MKTINTPVTIDQDFHNIIVDSEGNELECNDREQAAELAAILNSHDALVEAVKQICKIAPSEGPEPTLGQCVTRLFRCGEIAAAALKLAEGK